MPAGTIAIVVSTQAAAQAHKARVEACRAVVQSFDSKTATVEQQQHYAECVQVLHPREWNRDELLAAKGLVLTFIIAGIIGMFVCKKKEYHPYLVDYLMYAFGFMLAWLGIGALITLFAWLVLA